MNEVKEIPIEREAGCYWTKLNGVSFVSVWNGETWQIPGQYGQMRDEQFEKIGASKVIPTDPDFTNYGEK